MNAPLACVVVVSAAICMSGCSALGPRPDDDLLVLAEQALADGRTEDADALYTEIARLCGTNEQGETPSSCAVERSSGDHVASPAPLGLYLEALPKVPEESHDLVVEQAIELATRDSSELSPSDISESDHDIVADMITREHAAVYALKSARAFASDPQAVDRLVDTHQQRLIVLEQSLADAPVAAPGYLGSTAELGDEFILAEEDNLIAAWRAAAADASSPAFLIAAAADAINSYRDYL